MLHSNISIPWRTDTLCGVHWHLKILASTPKCGMNDLMLHICGSKWCLRCGLEKWMWDLAVRHKCKRSLWSVWKSSMTDLFVPVSACLPRRWTVYQTRFDSGPVTPPDLLALTVWCHVSYALCLSLTTSLRLLVCQLASSTPPHWLWTHHLSVVLQWRHGPSCGRCKFRDCFLCYNWVHTM